MRMFLLTTFVFLTSLAALFADDRPNIVLIMVDGRTELNDLSKSQPDRLRELQARWQQLAEEVGVEKKQANGGKKKKKK